MKMKHVMAALLFGVVAVGAVQAQETHYKYYPVTTEVYGGEIINTTDLDEVCRIAVQNYSEQWLEPSTPFQGGYGAFGMRWLDYNDKKTSNPTREITCSYKQRTKLRDGSWTEWWDANGLSLASLSCRNGGRLLWPDEDRCAEQIAGPIPEESKCDSSYYADGVVPADCPKPDPCEKAREDLLNNGTPLPEGCAEFPQNDGLCPRKLGDLGVVACTVFPKKKMICIYPENFVDPNNDANPNSVTDKVARQILYTCVKDHEQVHADDPKGKCINNIIKFSVDNGDLDRSEISGHKVLVSCMTKFTDQCKFSDDPVECKRQVDNFKKLGGIDEIEFYKEELKRKGLNE